MKENGTPEQGPRASRASPPARGLLPPPPPGLPGLTSWCKRPSGAPHALNLEGVGVYERMPRSWDGRRLGGAVCSACPLPLTLTLQRLQHTKVWAVQTQAFPTRVGYSVSSQPQPPSPSNANTPRASRGELPAEAQERRPQERPGLRGRGPAAIRLPPPLTPSRLLLSLGACSIEPPKPAAGGNRRKVARGSGGAGTIRFPPDLAREQRRAQCGQRSRAPSSPCAAPRTRLRIPCDCTERLRTAGKLLLLGCWRQMGGGPSHRQVSRGKGAMRSEAVELGSPQRRGRSEAEPLPFRLGGHQPRALQPRTLAGHPEEENHYEGKGRGPGRAGEKRRVASGQARRIKFHSQEDTHSHTSLVCLENCLGLK